MKKSNKLQSARKWYKHRLIIVAIIVVCLLFLPIRTKWITEEYTKETTVSVGNVPTCTEEEVSKPYNYQIINKEHKHELVDFDIFYGEVVSFDVLNLEEKNGVFDINVRFYNNDNTLRGSKYEQGLISAKDSRHFTFTHDSGEGDNIIVKINISPPNKKVIEQKIVYETLNQTAIETTSLEVPRTVNWIFGYGQNFGLKLF